MKTTFNLLKSIFYGRTFETMILGPNRPNTTLDTKYRPAITESTLLYILCIYVGA